MLHDMVFKMVDSCKFLPRGVCGVAKVPPQLTSWLLLNGTMWAPIDVDLNISSSTGAKHSHSKSKSWKQTRMLTGLVPSAQMFQTTQRFDRKPMSQIGLKTMKDLKFAEEHHRPRWLGVNTSKTGAWHTKTKERKKQITPLVMDKNVCETKIVCPA